MRISIVQLLAAVCLMLASQEGRSEEAPPMPPGYKTTQEVMQAVQSGEVPILMPSPGLPRGVTQEIGVEYGRVGDRALLLDIYYRPQAEEKVPVLIFIHGGGWEGGTRDIYHYYMKRYAEKGFVTATISYRLSGEAPFPAAVEDAKCAVRFMRCQADKYGIDTDRIAVIGGSAGGHLSMMIGYSSDVPELEGDGGHPTHTSRVAAVVNFYGPTDMTTEFARTKKVVKKFLGGKTYEEAPELYEQVSPLFYLTPDDPPTLTFHGTIDDIVPVSQAEALHKKLDELGIPNEYEAFPGWPHTMDMAKPVSDRCLYFMDRFFEKHLDFPPKETVSN
jgi:acetyl esterase/lipase